MTIRTRIRRWWIGGDLYDRAVLSVALADNTEGRDAAWRFIRELHAEHPDPGRRCSVPDCCGGAR